MKSVTLLYAEDDETLGYLTKDNLQLRGFHVIHCSDGKEALEKFNSHTVDLCLLDIMLPNVDGFEVAKEIRKINHQVPILFLTAKTLSDDKIRGLQTGADDYIIKPFNMEELVLRIMVFLKRAKITETNESKYRVGSFEFDYINLELKTGQKKIIMTQREADLLRFFLENKGSIIKRENILKTIWGDDDYFMGRSLDVFISRLRKYLSADPQLTIENIHGVGFRFDKTDFDPNG